MMVKRLFDLFPFFLFSLFQTAWTGSAGRVYLYRGLPGGMAGAADRRSHVLRSIIMLSDEALPRLAERAGFIVVERPSGQQICDAATAVEGGVVNFVPTHVQPNKILGTTGLQSEQVDGVREWPGIILVTRQLADGSSTGAVDELTRLLSSPAASDTAPAAANPGICVYPLPPDMPHTGPNMFHMCGKRESESEREGGRGRGREFSCIECVVLYRMCSLT